MRTSKKILSMILALVMVLGLLPVTTLATEPEEAVVYLSISFDSNYIDDKNGNPIAYIPIPLDTIAAIDLAEYGLENMLWDGDGDGNYDTTALQLLIYAHEELYGGDWSDVNFSAYPGSSYFAGGIFGFTENLVYFHNGDFPVDETQQSDYYTVGATSDRIVLEAGDFLDVASFGCYAFLWDQAGGFHLFADENDSYTHDYAVTAGQALSVKLKHSFCDLMTGTAWVQDAADYEVFYGSVFGEAEGSVITDGSGCAEVTFSTAGTYYVWCNGGNGSDDGTHGGCDYCLETGEPCIVSSPAFARVTVTGGQAPEEPRQPQDVSAVLNATMAQLAATVTEPAFGTTAGEWTVFSLARGGYFAKDSQYFADYYDRIVEYVNTEAAKLDMDGALHRSKSTDNSRLIMALTAIGKNATGVGNWDLVEAYSANGMNWIRKQGLNGTIWTLIALDCGSYETSDPTIRQQCVESILSLQHDDGGWSLTASPSTASNVDITGMTLTALYPYREQEAVAQACAEAIAWLSDSQLDNGGFPYGTGETSESCAWAIVALTTWGINPDTDPRFIKNGNSAIDNLLTYYVEEEAMFEHGRGAGSNAMATDQCCYALVAYDRFISGKPALYDYSDVTLDPPDEPEKMTAVLGLPEKVSPESEFNAIISVNQWDNEAGFRLIDFIVSIPTGLEVIDVTAGSRLSGGQVSWHLEEETGKLRVVYFDANEGTALTVSGADFPAELFNLSLRARESAAGNRWQIALTGMSVKRGSDAASEDAMVVVDSSNAAGTVEVTPTLSFSAVCLYTGDGVDLIPAGRKMVAVAVTNLTSGAVLRYNDGTFSFAFKYSPEISSKTGVSTFVAMVNSDIAMENFVNKEYLEVIEASSDSITFGDVNGDGVVNAQDALAVVDAWLRKDAQPTDEQLMVMNVNGDSRINTFDALGIVEAFVDGREFFVVSKASVITTRQ